MLWCRSVCCYDVEVFGAKMYKYLVLWCRSVWCYDVEVFGVMM